MQERLRQDRESSTIGRLMRLQEVCEERGYYTITEPAKASAGEAVHASIPGRQSPKDLTDAAKAHCKVSNLDALARRLSVSYGTLMNLRRGLKKNGTEPITSGTRDTIARNLNQRGFDCKPNDLLWNFNRDNKIV
jgi:hypothetical protein